MKSSAPVPGPLWSGVKPRPNPSTSAVIGMLEALQDDEFQLRRSQLRLDVDGDAVVGRVVDQAHLVVRRLTRAQPDLDRLSLEHSVRMQRHASSTGGTGFL